MFIKSYTKLSLQHGQIHGRDNNYLSFNATTLFDENLLIISSGVVATWIYRELLNPVDLFCGATLIGHPVQGFNCTHFECVAVEFYWAYEVKGYISRSEALSNGQEFRIEIQPNCRKKIKLKHVVDSGELIPVHTGAEVHLIETFSQKISINEANKLSSIYSVPVLRPFRAQSLSLQAKIA